MKPNNTTSFMEGDMVSQVTARKILPILIKRTKLNNMPITYKNLGEQVNKHHRALAWSLGFIGEQLEKLAKNNNNFRDVPMVQALVVNKKTGIPGIGLYQFIGVGENSLENIKKKKIEKYWGKIKDYKKWNEVLKLIPKK
jgi:hypothetical protein